MLKAMLFDMDGVIVDTEPLHHKAYIQMFEEVGIDVSLKMYDEFTGQSTMSICKQLCEFFNLKINPQKLVDIKRNNFTKLFYEDNQLKLIDGVDEKVAINESAIPWHKVVSFPKETFNEESMVIINESDTAEHGPIGLSVVIINVAS